MEKQPRTFMLRPTVWPIVAFLLIWCATSGIAAELRDIIGSYHHSPKYTFQSWPVTDGTKRDSLNEGADALLQLGSRVIRVQLHPNGKAYYWYTANPSFPDNSIYGLAPELRILEMARSVQYDTLFRKPFSTIILTIDCNMPVPAPTGEDFVHFGNCGVGESGAPLFDGVTAAELAIEKAAIKNLAAHLLTAYAHSGKTFVLATGEGDWIARMPHWGNADFRITPLRAQAMVQWINARADGVAEARQQVGQHGVQVYSSAEVNFVTQAINNSEITITNDVLPLTHCDLYSYTAYGVNNDEDALLQHLEYVASKAPNSATFGERNVFLGEYGAAENRDYGGDTARINTDIRRMTEAAVAWGAPYVILWELFDATPLPEYAAN